MLPSILRGKRPLGTNGRNVPSSESIQQLGAAVDGYGGDLEPESPFISKTEASGRELMNIDVLWEQKWFGSWRESTKPARSTSMPDGPSCSVSAKSSGHSSSASITANHASQPRRISSNEGDVKFSPVRSRAIDGQAVATLRNAVPNALAGQQQQQQGNQPLGTWAKRQIRLIKDDPAAGQLLKQEDTTPGSIVAAFLREQAAQEANHDFGMHGEDAVADAAWRWRFARRWHAEQTREIDPAANSAGDKLDSALNFVQAGGINGWNVQSTLAANRTESHDLAFLMNSLGRGTSICGGDGQLAEESAIDWTVSQRQRFLGQDATREMHSICDKAELLAAGEQQQLEQQSWQMWEQPNSGAWIGNLLPTVDIDDWGTFRFIVIKICNLAGQKCILVQGHNHCTDAGLIESANRKVMQLSIQHGLRAETLLIMGGGVMEWRRDRNRWLKLHSGYCSDSSFGAAAKPEDLLNLAAVLVRSSLPAGCTVSLDE